MKEKLKNFAWGYVILFAILTAIGILCICFHGTLPYVALGIGIVITLYGIIYGVLAIASKERGPKFAFRITIAICSIIAGVITMVFCKKAINVLTALMGLFLIIDGSFKLQSAALSKRYKSVGWWILLVPSLISIIGGFFITRYESNGTDDSVALISVSLGIILIIDALSNFLTAFLSGKLTAAVPKEKKEEEVAPLPEAKDEDKAPLPEANADSEIKDEKPASGEDTRDAKPNDAKTEAVENEPSDGAGSNVKEPKIDTDEKSKIDDE